MISYNDDDDAYDASSLSSSTWYIPTYYAIPAATAPHPPSSKLRNLWIENTL